MSEESCVMELGLLIDRYGEKYIVEHLAALVGQRQLERARTEYFLDQAFSTCTAPNLDM
ncbi:MAG: hypothetical protein JXO49_01600 [Deltaproteobacteria bacterium]|nr:hypothetical protein [Candidatus Anaeroferrophillus wilburensis]MBN2888022.1 hypothetical protein [Deltaproteobacteria bacterium]